MDTSEDDEDHNQDTNTGLGTTGANTTNNTTNNGNNEGDADKLKRAAIREIMANSSLDPQTKQMQIQQLMSGKILQTQHANTATVAATSSIFSNLQLNDHHQTTTGASVAANASVATATAAQQTEVMKCVHYERNCNIVAPCCGLIFGCRVCHDENSADHEIDRFLIREIICKECGTRQERTNKCIKCNIQFGKYHCNFCNLWMSTDKQPFHCHKCNICRVGGQQNFTHCDQCNMCISINAFTSHMCLKDKFKNSCPICREDMQTSRQASLDLPCGHAIHTHCFRKLASYDYRCPMCKKTVVSSSNMARAWEDRARDIESQPMPDDLRRMVNIWCNDCEHRSVDRSWHFLGVQCPHCKSFNTAVETSSSGSSGAGGTGSSQRNR